MARESGRGTFVGSADRLRFIEGLRGLAALYVVFGHFYSMADPRAFMAKPSFAQPFTQTVMAPFMYGHLAVAAFIVISGFCLQMALFHGGSGRIMDLKKFFLRRSIRILPPYYAALVLSLLAALYVTPLGEGMPFSQYLPVTAENVAAHALMVHNLSPDWMYKINGVMWSIAIEAQLYLLFPLLVLLLAKGGRFLLASVTVSATLVVLSAYPESIKLYPWYLALFGVGMVAAHLAFRPHLRLGPVPWLGLVVAAVSFGWVGYAISERMLLPWRDAGIGVATAALLYVGATAPTGLVTRALGWRPLVAIGTMSYSLYLMHHPIQQAVYLFRPASVTGVENELLYLFGVGLPVILVGCALFWLVAERPFLHSKKYEEADRRSYTPVSLPLRVGGVASEPREEQPELAPAAPSLALM